MRVPVSWLREYVSFEQPVDELARLLTFAGLEVDHLERSGGDWDRIYVGQVVEIAAHPDADRLVLAERDRTARPLREVVGG